MGKKEEFYSWVRILGLASLIPFVLISGPLGGYFLGDYLERTFGIRAQPTLIFTLAGLIASLFETVRIIRVMVKIERK